jgi:Icc-related predicted phosphoesterase
MLIAAVSDLHGNLPEVPKCDLLLLAGDLCPLRDHRPEAQARWLDTAFRGWLEKVPARRIVGVCGNHDFVYEKLPEAVPGDLPWSYLQDSGIDWEGVRIWGSPWQPWFHDWAFNLREDELERVWAKIPEGADILVLHGPPYGYGDGVPRGGTVEHTGSPSLTERIRQVRPKLVVFGHIHEGRGVYQLGPTVLANVSLLDAAYRPVHPVWTHELSVGPCE